MQIFGLLIKSNVSDEIKVLEEFCCSQTKERNQYCLRNCLRIALRHFEEVMKL